MEHSGACRDQNGQYKDKGTVYGVSLLRCHQSCDTTQGCGAVSYKGDMCFMTSFMANTTAETIWKCYSKGSIWPIFANFLLNGT